MKVQKAKQNFIQATRDYFTFPSVWPGSSLSV